MKKSEFRQLIREEIRKVLKEAINWDNKAILKFFKYLQDRHGMVVKNPNFKTPTSGDVEILMGGPGFDAAFMVDGSGNLILKPDSASDMSAKDFLSDIKADGAVGYNFQIKGKSVIVTM